MHIPDGFINGATSAGFAVAAVGGVGIAIRQAGTYLNERQVPLAGLVAAFVFAAQMFNFPVIPGMSGHLIGGVLTAVLLGPWGGAVVLSVVVIVQGIFFADGGLSALGLNIMNIGLIITLGGYLIYLGVLRAFPAMRSPVARSAGIAAFLSVPLASMGFVIQFIIGGNVDIPIGGMVAAILGVHLLIGVGEGVLTGLIVGTVMHNRPDLVYGATRYIENRAKKARR